MPPLLLQYLVVGLGGALGSMLRFGMATVIDVRVQKAGQLFPWGTIIVNITGCFVIGLMAGLAQPESRIFVPQIARQFIMIGILGGYTTFSSFSLQTLMLAREGEFFGAGANVVISVVCCLVGVWLGFVAVSAWNQLR